MHSMSSGPEEAPPRGGEPRVAGSGADGRRDAEDFNGLGQELAVRVLAASLELHSALSVMGEGPAANRCARAAGELDGAIRRVRPLALAAQRRAARQQPAERGKRQQRSGKTARQAPRDTP
jgi:hypothetical protein